MMIKEFKFSRIVKKVMSVENFSRFSTWIGTIIIALAIMDILGIINPRVLLDIVAITLGVYLVTLGVPEIIKSDDSVIEVSEE